MPRLSAFLMLFAGNGWLLFVAFGRRWSVAVAAVLVELALEVGYFVLQ